ncbi:MAG: glycerol-3-phosphate acyltransferase, partial [Atopobium sp.]|nr:glycerol-3-phosphate acyltransferase [Atopobium sp.]
RNAGKAAGILTLLCDAGKGIVSVMLVRWFLGAQGFTPLVSGNDHAEAELIISFVYACCVLGHIFSPWLHFHGGKGIAVGFGGGLAVNPLAALVALAVFITLAVPTKYVSLGSIGAAVAIPLFCLLFGMDPVATIPVFVVAAAVIWAHRENINRLNAGSESKFSFGEKKKDN